METIFILRLDRKFFVIPLQSILTELLVRMIRKPLSERQMNKCLDNQTQRN